MNTQYTIIKPEMIAWARKRIGAGIDVFASRMNVSSERVKEWEAGKKEITMNQAKRLASLALLPLGVLFLDEVPLDRVVLPDFRTVKSSPLSNPSPELEAIILEMQEKQEWLRDYLIENNYDELSFVGSITTQTSVSDTVNRIQEIVGLSQKQKERCQKWEDYFNLLVERIEDAGVTVIRSGIYGNDTHRPLNVEEFRGFVLADSYAPLIFINGSDSRNAQMFTLVHEFVHIMLGKEGVSNFSLMSSSQNNVEQYCNKVAAEFLVPGSNLIEQCKAMPQDAQSIERHLHVLSKNYMVSTLVLISRCRELGIINSDLAQRLWDKDIAIILSNKARSGGHGSFFANLRQRVGRNFARIVIAETAANNITYQDAFRLLRVKNTEGLVKLSQEVGLPIL